MFDSEELRKLATENLTVQIGSSELVSLLDECDRLRGLSECECGDGFTENDKGLCVNCVSGITAPYSVKISELEAANEKMSDALLKIKNWAGAYPLDVFPEPDMKR